VNDPEPRPELRALHISDHPARWRALGFAVDAHGVARVGGIDVHLGASGHGITGWEIAGISPADLDGLPSPARGAAATGAPEHPNRAIAIDHVVIVTPDFDRTSRALEEAGMSLRRIRDAGGFRQGFRRLGPAILELVEDQTPADRNRPAAFW
jgi:hypothetical protein